MKSIRSCNDHEHEDDIELLSPPSASNNSRLKVTTSTYAAVSCDDTTTSSIFNHDSKRSIKAHDEIVSFQSKCHIDDIPVEARGWTWNDPFYDMNDPINHDIIAVFDIDRTGYDKSTVDLFKWSFLILLVLAALQSVLKMFGAPHDLFFACVCRQLVDYIFNSGLCAIGEEVADQAHSYCHCYSWYLPR